MLVMNNYNKHRIKMITIIKVFGIIGYGDKTEFHSDFILQLKGEFSMFWDKISGIYDLYQIVNKKVNDKAAYLCAQQIKKNDIVLECACGTGIMTKVIAPCCRKLIAT
ncbi:MAG: hypothetical protein K6E47_10165, partial [Lachnospiraceae bacterium]|nr:hypothetical protein [Lachnospiraceae bacterium]